MSLGLAIAQAVPIYNLGLVIIALFLFIKLFNTPIKDRRVYLFPWKLIFIALTIFVVEEVLTVLRAFDIINIPIHINGFFELLIITTYIYALLLQKEHLKTR